MVSQSRDWCTPHRYVAAVTEALGGRIALDPCSNEYSVVGAQVAYLLPKKDGLRESWDYPTIYVNPPYGSDKERGTTIKHWLKKCAEANREHGSEVIALVPVATNTAHWKLYVWGAATSVAFLYDTRLKFLVAGRDTTKGAPMSCAMVYWGTHIARFESIFLPFGAVVDLRHLSDKAVGLAHHKNGVLSLL